MAIDGVNFSSAGTYTAGGTKTTSSADSLGMDDFFKLMAAQLQNQSMFDETDNTQFLAQLAQFSTLSQISELTSAVKTNLAISLIGSAVVVPAANLPGGYKAGVVESVGLSGGVPYVQVDGGYYSLADLIEIGGIPKSPEQTADPESDAANSVT